MAAQANKKTIKCTFKVDYRVGLDEKGKPKKEYRAGKSYNLDEATAEYFKSKNIVQ
jgi:hypothetical protein|tara:strand:- start:308 stop:475 length:168 start_codon:yes stop_codon:yes gene_type:complete